MGSGKAGCDDTVCAVYSGVYIETILKTILSVCDNNDLCGEQFSKCLTKKNCVETILVKGCVPVVC